MNKYSGKQIIGAGEALLSEDISRNPEKYCPDERKDSSGSGLIKHEGYWYQLTDIGMRMLQPKELFLANGFPKDYKFAIIYNGKVISKSEQVAKCGTAVPPQFSEAIFRANLPELCVSNNPVREA